MTMDDFLVRAALAGVAVALVSGPLGVFVVWQRLSYFGAALSHAALLGVAGGILLGVSPIIGVAVVSVLAALLLAGARNHTGAQRGMFSTDTLLGIIAHGTLALGLIVVAFLEGVRFDLMGYLFGDILAVSQADLYWMYGGAFVVLAALGILWRSLVAVAVHAELAFVEGVPVRAVETALMVLLAVLVALAMKVVGILLITSLLIIPAAAARPLATSPEGMAGMAVVAGVLSVMGGLTGAVSFDLPAGPAIVMAALALFVAVLFGVQGVQAIRRRG